MEDTAKIIVLTSIGFVVILLVIHILRGLCYDFEYQIIKKNTNESIKMVLIVLATRALPSIPAFIIFWILYEYQINLLWFSWLKTCVWIGMLEVGISCLIISIRVFSSIGLILFTNNKISE